MAIVAVLGALLLSAPAVANGAPLLYFDSEAYLRRAETALRALWPALAPHPPSAPADMTGAEGERVVIAGRSVYYGLLAYGALRLTTIWGLVAAQAAALAWTVALALRCAVPSAGPGAALAILAALALLTPAGIFAGLVMPDVWAGILILAAALLTACHDRLGAPARRALAALAAFAALAHASHLALLAGGLAILAGARILWPRARPRLPLAGLGTLAACLALGLLGAQAFAIAAERAAGAPPIARPHLTARLIDTGPGLAHARAACPEAGYALCGEIDRLPQGWIAFLFAPGSEGPGSEGEGGVFATAPPALKRALAAEQGRFAMGTLAADPVGTLGALARGAMAQLWTLSLDDLSIGPETSPARLAAVPPPLMERTRASWLWRHPGALEAAGALSAATAALSAAALATALASGRGIAPGSRLPAIVALCLGGLVLNAVICGALASPYGRFQARVVWIVPLLAGLALAARCTAAREPRSAAAP